MFKFRKKPIEIEAFRHKSDAGQETTAYPQWLISACVNGVVFADGGAAYIRTLEGNMLVNDGDWIIRGVKGELYPCKPDIFAATYDPVDE